MGFWGKRCSLVLLWASLVQAAPPLTPFAKGLSDQYSGGKIDEVIPADLKNKIRNLLASPDSDRNHAERIARTVYEGRLLQLEALRNNAGGPLFSQEEIGNLRAVFDKNSLSTQSSHISGSFGKAGVVIRIPLSMQNTWLHYGILLHELEHRIQQDLSVKWGDPAATIVEGEFRFRNAPGEMFLSELGSISLEAAYLQLMPHEARREQAYLVKTSAQLSADSKRFAMRMLSVPSGSVSQHVEREWRNGRYGWDQTEKGKTVLPDILAAFPEAIHAFKGGLVNAVCDWGYGLVKAMGGG